MGVLAFRSYRVIAGIGRLFGGGVLSSSESYAMSISAREYVADPAAEAVCSLGGPSNAASEVEAPSPVSRVVLRGYRVGAEIGRSTGGVDFSSSGLHVMSISVREYVAEAAAGQHLIREGLPTRRPRSRCHHLLLVFVVSQVLVGMKT